VNGEINQLFFSGLIRSLPSSGNISDRCLCFRLKFDIENIELTNLKEFIYFYFEIFLKLNESTYEK